MSCDPEQVRWYSVMGRSAIAPAVLETLPAEHAALRREEERGG